MLAGWGTAVGWAALTAATLGVLAAVPALLTLARAGHPSIMTLAGGAGVLFLEFHHVGLVAEVSGVSVGSATGGFSASVAVGLLSGTVVALWLTALGGGAVARRAGGSPWARALHGAKVGVPYAAICFGASFLLRYRTSVAGTGSVEVHASHLGALLWPLGLTVAAGLVGGRRSALRDDLSTPDDGPAVAPVAAKPRRAEILGRAAFLGGATMMVAGLALSFVGLLVLAVLHPNLTGDYFRAAFDGGGLSGATLVYLHALTIPAMAAWALFPSMGACLGAWGGPVSACAVSYTRFPHGAGPGSQANLVNGGASALAQHLAAPPAVWFLWVLVPLVAVIWGGARAARSVGPSGPFPGAVAGAVAGIVFAVLALAVAVLADVVVGAGAVFTSFSGSATVRIGPHPLAVLVVAVAWGVAGGAVGGGLGARAPTGRMGPAWQSVCGS